MGALIAVWNSAYSRQEEMTLMKLLKGESRIENIMGIQTQKEIDRPIEHTFF